MFTTNCGIKYYSTQTKDREYLQFKPQAMCKQERTTHARLQLKQCKWVSE